MGTEMISSIFGCFGERTRSQTADGEISDDEGCSSSNLSPIGNLSYENSLGCNCSLHAVDFKNAPRGDKRVAAVVVSISDGSSYDAMFTTIAQEGEAGTCVSVFSTSSSSLKSILRALNGEAPLQSDSRKLKKMVKQLMADIDLVDNDCVVFNWECCDGCGDDGFPSDSKQDVMELIACVIERGSMVMCSDFSLKALIADWAPDMLGPNPFLNVGSFSNRFKLTFDPDTLAKCPSSQLQKVGELCSERGDAMVSAMGGTIAYTVDLSKTNHNAFTLQVLSVASEMGGFDVSTIPSEKRCKIKEVGGSAGHVLLRYPTGGTLLTSAGHWLELSQLDVSMEALQAVAMSQYDAAFSAELIEDLSVESDSMEVRSAKVQRWSKRMVTSSPACEKRVSSKYW